MLYKVHIGQMYIPHTLRATDILYPYFVFVRKYVFNVLSLITIFWGISNVASEAMS